MFAAVPVYLALTSSWDGVESSAAAENKMFALDQR
jgi:hypothetical protein